MGRPAVPLGSPSSELRAVSAPTHAQQLLISSRGETRGAPFAAGLPPDLHSAWALDMPQITIESLARNSRPHTSHRGTIPLKTDYDRWHAWDS